MIEAIVNKGEGIYLNMKDITSFSIKEIQVNAEGDKCFALVCYPGPGAGYVVSRYNEEAKAHKAFQEMLDAYVAEGNLPLGIFQVESVYEEPKQKPAVNIGEAQLEVVKKN